MYVDLVDVCFSNFKIFWYYRYNIDGSRFSDERTKYDILIQNFSEFMFLKN